MASIGAILSCALVALALWAGPGWLLARVLTGRAGLRLLLGPALGWAVQAGVALVVATGMGLSVASILVSAGLVCLGALRIAPRRAAGGGAAPGEPGPVAAVLPALALAAVLAGIPAAAVVPKLSADGALMLAAPIYDHAKIALIDEIALHGVAPPANPVFGAGGGPGTVAYYYLWHFAAAQLAILAGATGWEADAAASWYSVFAALCLVAGLAFRFRPGWAAPLLALVVAASGGLRPVLGALFDPARIDGVLEPASGLGGILFQGSWSPHHLASACCVVLAVLLMAQMRARPSPAPAVLLAVVAVAAFQSSVWVGGVTLALAGGLAALTLVGRAPARGRVAFLAAMAAAGLGAVGLAAPLLMAQLQVAAMRGEAGLPLRIGPFAVLGPEVPDAVRPVLDLASYWLVLLPLEFPLLLLAGAVGFAGVVQAEAGERARRLAAALGALALGALAVSALLASTAGENNDLGWRAALPAVLVGSGFAGVALARWARAGRRGRLALALVLLVAGLPDAAGLAVRNLGGEASVDGRTFAADPAMWAQVRQEVPADVRLASNPARLARLAPWPVNLSWALLARRRSCFAGPELALAFAPLTADQRASATALFARVFSGSGTAQQMAQDVVALHGVFGCGAVLVTVQDGAWGRDPFSASPLFRRVREEPGRWRLYLAVPAPAGPPS